MRSVSAVLVATLFSQGLGGENEYHNYGVDVSFPIHHAEVSINYPDLLHNVNAGNISVPSEYVNMPVQPLGDKRSFYQDFLQACRDHHGTRGHMCDQTEKARIQMSLDQPQSMRNYTDTGYKKIKAPESLFNLLKNHWERNQDRKVKEQWPTGSTYVNYWESPTYMASVEQTAMRGGGSALQQRIYAAAKPILEEWTGQKLRPTSLYGVREYTRGAILAPHVDRNPLIISCIINVDQDVDEEWPLEVIGRDGLAYNITMEPGDMVLYESHSLIHARPFPLKGASYANTFIHFEPVVSKKATELPPYILEGSKSAEKWWILNPEGYSPPSVTTLQTAAHGAARDGDIDMLLSIAEKEGVAQLHQQDENGWQPLHEAVRSGHVDIVSFIIDQGGDINARTGNGIGGTPLWWSKNTHGDQHVMTDFLSSLGGLDIGPDL